jgi:hypothetical protein
MRRETAFTLRAKKSQMRTLFGCYVGLLIIKSCLSIHEQLFIGAIIVISSPIPLTGVQL